MANSTVKDMTTGNPVRLILGFAVPMLFGLLFQQFYSMVDTVIVGNWIGIDALAAVGSTGSINFMVIGFCMGVCSGFTIPVAQRFGSKDYKGLRKFVGSAVWTAVAMAAVMVLGLLRRVLHRPMSAQLLTSRPLSARLTSRPMAWLTASPR